MTLKVMKREHRLAALSLYIMGERKKERLERERERERKREGGREREKEITFNSDCTKSTQRRANFPCDASPCKSQISHKKYFQKKEFRLNWTLMWTLSARLLADRSFERIATIEKYGFGPKLRSFDDDDLEFVLACAL